LELQQAHETSQRIVENVGKVIFGKRDVIEKVLVALICGGHVLLEDVPGVGKTTLAKAVARSLGCKFGRIQFTPDLLPSDVTGVYIFDQSTREFAFREGPVFANIVLADEINRASPRTQSSLLECMEERQVTVDGTTHVLPAPFFVIATENPIEYEGIYPLPESQLDRFILRLSIGYPDREAERKVIREQVLRHPIEALEVVASQEDVLQLHGAVRRQYVADAVYDYVLDLVAATRQCERLYLGASPRAAVALFRSAQALALVRGREYVLPDDVKELAEAVLAHRVVVRPEARLAGVGAGEIVRDLLAKVPVPASNPTEWTSRTCV
jgi:MoxR-like ATPase